VTGAAIRDAHEADFDGVVALNAGEERQTSPMDMDRLRHLDALADYHRIVEVDGTIAAFLLAMRDGRAYRNTNYAWFAARYATFVYIDRIVVGARHQGLGFGCLLYHDLFEWARSRGIGVIACEYNIVPPNEPSRIFHRKFGFREVGSQCSDDATKQVSMQVAQI